MKLKPFKLERYFAKYEFSSKYLLSSSDCDGLSQNYVLSLADQEMKNIWNNLHLGYTESLGHPLLRNEISKLYQGISSNDCLVITPEEGIFIALNTILKKGDHVICTAPGYQSLYEIAEGLECEVTKWVPEEKNCWEFNLEFLKQSIKPNTKLIIINFPHNPTGYLPSKEYFQEIIDLAKKHDLYLFSDEMYRFLEFDPKYQLPAACEIYEKAVSLFGMSKTFGMAGVRIGWVVTRNKDLYDRMATFKDYTTICSSAPSEVLSIIALRAKGKIINKHLIRITRNLAILDIFFEEYKEKFDWVRPKGGTIGFPKLKGSRDSLQFCQDVVKKANIMILPSTVYDFDNSHFRLGFGRENMPEALEKLKEYIKEYE